MSLRWLPPFLSLLCGCSHHLHSPPARVLPIESARTVEAGETAVRLAGGVYSPLFQPAVSFGSGQVRRLLTEGLELSGELTVAHLHVKPIDDLWLTVILGRIGAKQRLDDGGNFALTGGLGAGAHGAGKLVAADAGVIAGYENRYATPFLSLSAFGSLPVAAREVDTSTRIDKPGEFFSEPHTTAGGEALLGLRIAAGRTGLLLGASLIYVSDGLHDQAAFGFGAAVELRH
jgi:hypothetical protein